MMFQPVLPLTGLPGWKLLTRTMEAQTGAFDASPRIARDTAYFEANIGKVTSGADLTADRRLLRVALGAFGLQDDINNRFLIQKVLESDLDDRRSLANSFSDTRYRQMSEAFAFGDALRGPRTQEPGFGAQITARFRAQSFEIAVGQQDESMRLALNARRELAQITARDLTDTTAWFRVLGTPPLRTVFETAFGLPESFGQLDIERQVQEFKTLAHNKLGIEKFDDFARPDRREALVESYLLRNHIKQSSSLSSQSIALALLQA